MSEPFSAGQYWVCLEMAADDGSLIMARVRLPRHPETAPLTDEEEVYAMRCEIATMKLVQQKLPGICIPCVYAYEGPDSKLATEAGAAYMLVEGFYGNTLKDVEFDLCNLPVTTQEHIIAQWTKVHAEIATSAYPQIDSISPPSPTGEPIVGKLTAAPAERMRDAGPFSTAAEYFSAVGQAEVDRFDADPDAGPAAFSRTGARIICDIVSTTQLFEDHTRIFSFNHMDLGTQNVLVDKYFNFLAIID